MSPLHRLSASPLLLAGLALAATSAAAEGGQAPRKTAAGSTIENTATASFQSADDGERTNVPSNTVTLLVDELIDVLVRSGDAQPVETRDAAKRQVTTFTVTNTGNGPESYRLSASVALTGDDFDPTNPTIFLDAPGGEVGRFDPGDLPYTPGSNDLDLPQDGSAVVFVLADMPAAAGDSQVGSVRLTATSVTGTGSPGLVIAGGGVNGGDAVVGASGGQSLDDGRYRVAAATVSLRKSQTVVDLFGGTRTVPGSTVTYTLEAQVAGSGSVAGLRLSDRVPTGSSYQPGSIALASAIKSDAADGDEAQFDAGEVSVSLGTVPAGETRTVSFRVTID